jgi:hypothetical protein
LADFFLEIFKIHRQVWIAIRIFGCFVSILSMFHFDLFKYSLYKKFLIYQRHSLKAYLWYDVPWYCMYMPCVMCVPTCPAALLTGRQAGPKVSTPPSPPLGSPIDLKI